MIPLPPGPFGAGIVDPPWLFKAYSPKGEGKSPQRHYNCPPLEVLMALPVADIMAKNSAIFMWTTWPREGAQGRRAIATRQPRYLALHGSLVRTLAQLDGPAAKKARAAAEPKPMGLAGMAAAHMRQYPLGTPLESDESVEGDVPTKRDEPVGGE
jgi:hypothetical protein